MKTRAIARVLVEAPATLFVYLQVEVPVDYEYIYREANGLRWNKQRLALCAYEPSRWEHEELLRHMAATFRKVFDEELVFTDRTTWVGVQPELQTRLRFALGKSS